MALLRPSRLLSAPRRCALHPVTTPTANARPHPHKRARARAAVWKGGVSQRPRGPRQGMKALIRIASRAKSDQASDEDSPLSSSQSEKSEKFVPE
eukprot:3675144-Prymnesium_polylepis.1